MPSDLHIIGDIRRAIGLVLSADISSELQQRGGTVKGKGPTGGSQPDRPRPMPTGASSDPAGRLWALTASVLSLPRRIRRFVSEIAHGGWGALMVFVGIAVARVWVGHRYGVCAGFIASLMALGLWSAIRPWELGPLSEDTRRAVCIMGSVAFAGWILRNGILYYTSLQQ